MNSEEPRYTEEEWKQKQRDDNVVSKVCHAFTGHSIRSIEVLQKIMSEIQIVTEPDVFKSYELGRCIALNMKDDDDAPV